MPDPAPPLAADSIRSRHLLVHYSEIALKGRNRTFFERALIRNVRTGLKGLGAEVRRLYGRLLVNFREEITLQSVRDRLSSIHGVSHFELALKTALEVDEILDTVEAMIADLDADSFAVITKRANKKFPLNSVEVNREVGQRVVDTKGWKVDLSDPTLPIYVYILDQNAFVALNRIPGPGGMPLGVAGKVVCLLSGGIDSPVASTRMMQRGCEPIFVHFHSAPYTDRASQDKVVELASRLMRYRGDARLYLLPFAELQQRIVEQTPAPLRIILYRRFMIRTAEAIAHTEGAGALVTGEALGQVSSQTLENLSTIAAVASLPILRPLIGMDKIEIIREAERIGTYETSIEPHDDCCSFLMPSQPATHSAPAQLEEAERVFDVDEEVRTLVEAAEVRAIGG